MPRKPTALAERLAARLNKNATCWLWTGAVNRGGYGVLGVAGRGSGNVLAHRAAYMTFVGPIPDGMCVCHRCDVRLCCNPDHLFLGTYADNNADMAAKGRAASGPEKRTPRGDRHYAAKVSSADVLVIRELRRTGTSGREIARRFGVSENVISGIVTGRTWKSVV